MRDVAVFVETIKLDDQVSDAAKAASSSVAGLSTGMASAQKTMSGTGSSAKVAGETMGKLGKSTFDAANAMQVGKETISAAFTGISNAAKSLAQGDVQGAVQGLTDSVADMAKMLDLVVPGLGQAVSAVIQIAGGLVGITAGLIKSGVEFAIASNESKQAMLGLFDAMGGGLVTGAETEAMIDGLKAKFGIAKDSLVEYTKALMAMGMTDLGQLEDQLLAVSSAAALVKGGDQALLSFTKKIQAAVDAGGKLKLPTKALATLSATGANVGDVAKAMGVSTEELTKNLAAGTVDAKKFGDALNKAIIEKGKGPLERMAASSANLKKLLSEAWGDLFEDIDVGPFMQEVKKLFDIFGQGTKSGEALKAGIGGFFKQVLAALTKVVPLAKHFLLDLVIWGLKAYIAIKPIVAEIKKFAESTEGAEMISTVLSSLWTVLKAVGAAVLVVVGVMGLMWTAMIAVTIAVWTAVGAFLGFVADVSGAFSGWVASAATAAYDFVAGLVSGITSGASMVTGAVKGLADGAVGAFKGALGIASPSKVMMGIGGNMTDGMSAGLEAGAGDVAGASSGVADAAVKGASSPSESGGGAAGGGGGAPITVLVQIDGAGKSAQEITEEMVSQVFQRVALERGI